MPTCRPAPRSWSWPPASGSSRRSAGCKSGLKAQRIVHRVGDSTDRATIDSLGVEDFDHIIVLCYSDILDASRADARTLVTLLHLRDIASRLDRDFSIVSEMLDLRDRALAEVARADDFIVSDRLISLMIAQVAESKHLNAVFSDLLDPAGSEIYLKPAGDYVALGVELPFAAVLESARRRNEIAFGYRIAAQSGDAAAAYGVAVNPAKSSPDHVHRRRSGDRPRRGLKPGD